MCTVATGNNLLGTKLEWSLVINKPDHVANKNDC